LRLIVIGCSRCVCNELAHDGCESAAFIWLARTTENFVERLCVFARHVTGSDRVLQTTLLESKSA